MRETLGEKILKAILAGAGTTVDVIETILESGYGASYSKLDRNLSRARSRRTYADLSRVERQRFYNSLSKLKKEGIISSKSRQWRFTSMGRKKLTAISKARKNRLPSAEYSKEVSKDGVIITFDIPEKERRKRRWLRSALRNLGFRLYQKSVWIGKGKIPEEFLRDLKNLRILKYVGILSVSKSGTIGEYIKDFNE